jgi:hypothetical protein
MNGKTIEIIACMGMNEQGVNEYAILCTPCDEVWEVTQRHRQVSCPKCRQRADLQTLLAEYAQEDEYVREVLAVFSDVGDRARVVSVTPKFTRAEVARMQEIFFTTCQERVS